VLVGLRRSSNFKLMASTPTPIAATTHYIFYNLQNRVRLILLVTAMGVGEKIFCFMKEKSRFLGRD
jgi:hypothetical protein